MKKDVDMPKIWEEKYKTEGSNDDIYLRLNQSDSSEIYVEICDKNGNAIEKGSRILSFDFGFNIVILCEGVSKNLPVKTDITDTVLTERVEDVISYTNRLLMSKRMYEMVKEHKESNTHKTSTH
jgi:hypothetical protein